MPCELRRIVSVVCIFTPVLNVLVVDSCCNVSAVHTSAVKCCTTFHSCTVNSRCVSAQDSSHVWPCDLCNVSNRTIILHHPFQASLHHVYMYICCLVYSNIISISTTSPDLQVRVATPAHSYISVIPASHYFTQNERCTVHQITVLFLYK